MRQVFYQTSCRGIPIPEELTTDRQKDFYISVYKHMKSDRYTIEPETIVKAMPAFIVNYPRGKKNKAVKLSLTLYAIIRHSRMFYERSGITPNEAQGIKTL